MSHSMNCKWIHIYQLENMGLPHFTQEYPYFIEISNSSLTHKYNRTQLVECTNS